MEDLYIRFRDNTKKHLKERNLSIARLEEMSGIKTGSLRNIIYGASRNPSLFTVYKVAQAFKMPIDQLIQATQEENQKNSFYNDLNLIIKIFSYFLEHIDDRKNMQDLFLLANKAYDYCTKLKAFNFDESFCEYLLKNIDLYIQNRKP